VLTTFVLYLHTGYLPTTQTNQSKQLDNVMCCR